MKKIILYMRKKKIGRVPLSVLLVIALLVSAIAVVSAANASDWFTEKEPVTGYSYSMVLVGDTQKTLLQNPELFPEIYNWILENKEAKNIQYVIGLGDITDCDTEAEWETAYREISKMDGVVGYSLCIGNHDSTEMFNKYFANGSYMSSYEGSFDETIENTWRTLVVGDNKYLIMTLDSGPSDEVLDWACSVVEAHADYEVIVTTHAYLHGDGTTTSPGKDWVVSEKNSAFNDGYEIWDKFASQYENISMVFSGHVGSEQVVMSEAEGVHGNTVVQMLINPQGVDAKQGSTGMITVLYFSEDGKQVNVETYSTIRQQYFLESNQFEFTLD